MKNIDVCIKPLTTAIKQAEIVASRSTLENKIKYKRLKKHLLEIKRLLIAQTFEIEDLHNEHKRMTT